MCEPFIFTYIYVKPIIVFKDELPIGDIDTIHHQLGHKKHIMSQCKELCYVVALSKILFVEHVLNPLSTGEGYSLASLVLKVIIDQTNTRSL